MTQLYRPKGSFGKVFFGVIVALIVGLFGSFWPVVQVMVVAIGLMPIAGVVLYASAGVIPLAVLIASNVYWSFVGFGGTMGAIVLPMTVVPVLVMIHALRRRERFFAQLTKALIACLGGAMVSILLAAFTFGADMIEQFINLLREYAQITLPMYWEVIGSLYTGSVLTITYEEFVRSYMDGLTWIQIYLEQSMPGNLLAGGALTAVLAVFWGNWKLARRGEATEESFIGLSEWHMPTGMVTGLLLTLLVSAFLTGTELNGAVTARVVVGKLATIAFAIQALAAFDRRMKASGATRRRRVGAIVLLFVLGPLPAALMFQTDLLTVLAFVGCVSALLGRKGALRLWLEKAKDKLDGDDR